MKHSIIIIGLASILLLASCTARNPEPKIETTLTPSSIPIEIHKTPTFMPTEMPETPTPFPAETHEPSSKNEVMEASIAAPLIMPKTLDGISALSDNTVRFAGVEGEFKSIEYYSESRLLFGEYSVALTKGKTSVIEFSEDFLKIDENEIQFEYYYRPTEFFIVDLDVSDECYEILIWEYGTNDWIDNALYRYDGNSVTEVARFIGWAFIDSYGKLIITNNVGGDFPGVISDPRITRSYYEYRKGILEEILVPIKGMTFTFAEEYASFGFYETPDAPTDEFVQELISGSYNFDSVDIGSGIYERNFAGKRFTILDHSEQESWFRGAWYYVQLENGRKGIIHWWYAG